MFGRLVANWVYGGFLAGILLMILTPVIASGWSPALVATFLLLPAYMLHQYEEHDDDRFRRFLNQLIGQGKNVLTPQAVFIINVPVVWGLIALSFSLAFTFDIGFAFMAIYLVLINAVIHIAHAMILRRYNPGLVTAVALFLPLGSYAFMAVQNASGNSLAMHATGFAVAAGVHIAIIAHVMRRNMRMRSTN